MVLILALSVTGYAIKAFNSFSIQAQRDINISTTLAEAKSALLGYSFVRVGAGERPGDMPYPDRLLSPVETPPVGGPPNYDGQTDSCSGAAVTMVCLGRLPWQTIGMAIENPTQNDVLGTMPWYAISANLADPACMNVINPSILNMTYTGYVCGSNTNLPHPWLTIRDGKGNIISNRVAIIFIMPGQPLGNQTRPNSPLADTTNYLDTVVVPAGCVAPCAPGTYSNSDLDNDFIMASGLTSANSDQNNQNLTSTINDKILYITIDELIVELTKRTAGEARALLNSYNTKVSHFPYAAPLGAALNNNISSGTSASGSLPIDVTDSCSCASASSCSCSFGVITNVAFRRASGTWSAANTAGSCTRTTNRICTCIGAGYCKNGSGTTNFTCDSAGLCTHNVTGIANTYTYTIPVYADVYSSTGSCTNISPAVCNGMGTYNIGLKEPTWFKSNLWQDYFYYHQSSLANLQVGTKTGVSALLVGAGSIIGAQTRPSNLIEDYLDSPENTNGDNVFDAIGTLRTNVYNDQSFIVAP
jgi:hypothetical protein